VNGIIIDCSGLGVLVRDIGVEVDIIVGFLDIDDDDVVE
jgi:hypothetical protein